jgi:hypothetical protein
MDTQTIDNDDQTAQTRKPYQTPELTVIGSLESVTRNAGDGFVDFPQGSRIV